MGSTVKHAALSLALAFLCRPAQAQEPAAVGGTGRFADAVGRFSLNDIGRPPREASSSISPAGEDLESPRPQAMGFSPALHLSPAMLGADGGEGMSYSGARIGSIWQLDELDFMDAGFIVEGFVGYKIIPLLALELSTGYFRNEGDEDGADVELWGIPAQANLVLRVPILFLQPYAGAGVGGYYVNAKVDALGDSWRNESFRFGVDAFVGLSLKVAFLRLGIEGKYFWTDQIAFPGDDLNLQTLAVMLSAALYF
jgi:hypothetical protein